MEIDTWVAQAGRNGMCRDWVMRCYQTGEVLAHATMYIVLVSTLRPVCYLETQDSAGQLLQAHDSVGFGRSKRLF